MKNLLKARVVFLFLFFVAAVRMDLAVFAQAVPQASTSPGLRGTITDPSGARVPNALVQIEGPSGEQQKTTDGFGQYSFPRPRSW